MANEKRLIDANALLDLLRPLEGVSLIIKKILAIIRNCPTVDAVEVVRCKDCQFFDKRGYEEDNRQQAIPELDFGWCSVLYRTEQACNFCSSGERKDNERKAD